MDEDEPIKIQIDNIDELDQVADGNAESNHVYNDSNKICNDTEDNSGKIIIPIDLGDDGKQFLVILLGQEEEIITSFKIPTADVSSKGNQV